MAEETPLSGVAFAALRADNPSILNGVDAEEAVNSCWRVLQLSISWFAMENSEDAELPYVVPDSLLDDLWANEWGYEAFLNAIDFDKLPPHFPKERLEHVVLMLLVQTCSVLLTIAEMKNSTYEEVLEELHKSYLTYRAIKD